MMREHMPDQGTWARIIKDLELEPLFGKPVSVLSNGQTRRAKIGKALLKKPSMLCLDAAFSELLYSSRALFQLSSWSLVGLDPLASKHLSKVLHRLSEAAQLRIVLSLRPQDSIPEWITHLVYAGTDGKISAIGPKNAVLTELVKESNHAEDSLTTPGDIRTDIRSELAELRAVGRHLVDNNVSQIAGTHQGNSHDTPISRDGYKTFDSNPATIGEPVVEMQGVRVQYSGNYVLGDWQQDVNGTKKDGLWWTVRRGERWVICGGNGTGKTTLLSLVTSDHPQTYSAPVRIFQRSRLPEPGTPGITIFELQSRIGHASPEVHALFPKRLSIRRTLESAWSDTPIMKPNLTADATKRVEACLRWFSEELNPSRKTQRDTPENLDWASHHLFGELSFSSQRILLFVRATIRNPDIVILDEAFSGMDDVARDKCLLFLSRGQTMQMEYKDSRPRPIESEMLKRSGDLVLSGLQESQALLCISHSMLEVPGCVREWVCLPEPGTGGPRFGRLKGPVELDRRRWDGIWDRGYAGQR
jgi:ABC-type molybdenum transport system ATPase subunit/photorepair protein PhrA